MNPNNHTTKKKPAAGKKRAGRLTQQMLRIMHTSLDQIELVLATIAPEPKPLPDDRDPLQRAVGRWTNNLLALWQQCDKPGCRRARRCCGMPTACLLARAPHVPPEALTGVKTMLNGRLRLDDLDLNAAARNEVGTVKARLGPGFPLHDRRHNLALHRPKRQTARAGGR